MCWRGGRRDLGARDWLSLTHQQAQNDLAQTALIGKRDLQKPQPDRSWTDRAHHRRFNPDRLILLIGLEDKSEKRSTRETRGLQGAPIHRNVGDAIRRLHPVVSEKLRLNRGGEPLVLPAVERL